MPNTYNHILHKKFDNMESLMFCLIIAIFIQFILTIQTRELVIQLNNTLSNITCNNQFNNDIDNIHGYLWHVYVTPGGVMPIIKHIP